MKTVHDYIYELRVEAGNVAAVDPARAENLRQQADLLSSLRDAPHGVAMWLRAQANACRDPVRVAVLKDAADCLESGVSFRFYEGQRPR